MVEEVTNEMLDALFEQQLRRWALARNNYQALAGVKEREVSLGLFSVKLQYNPARITSTGAAMSKAEEYPCFLCEDNRPCEQFEIPEVFGKYSVLVNPYPIFPRHFTIPAIKHTPQRMAGNYLDMLKLAHTLTDYVVFYNGPDCGASAPFHMHFQAGNKGFLPAEKFRKWGMIGLNVKDISQGSGIWHVTDTMRMIMAISFPDAESMLEAMDEYLRTISSLPGKEPGMNVLTWYDPASGLYNTLIFARKSHRPKCYYAEGEKRIIVSPGCVDMAGVIILPREEDFYKITEEDIRAIYAEVTLGDIQL